MKRLLSLINKSLWKLTFDFEVFIFYNERLFYYSDLKWSG